MQREEAVRGGMQMAFGTVFFLLLCRQFYFTDRPGQVPVAVYHQLHGDGIGCERGNTGGYIEISYGFITLYRNERKIFPAEISRNF